jgi:hypothetical protein
MAEPPETLTCPPRRIQSMQRPPMLSEFQRHDSRAFHRAVEAALLEAIQQAGSGREQVRQVDGAAPGVRAKPQSLRLRAGEHATIA